MNSEAANKFSKIDYINFSIFDLLRAKCTGNK